MWKALSVAGLWGLLIAAPHAVSAPSDDPGDPFALAAPPNPAPPPVPSGSFATVHFKNEVGKAYELSEAHFVLDGKPLPVLTDVKSGDDVVVFSGRVLPGPHVVQARLTYQGNRRGPVTYMRKYHLTVEAEEVLTVPKEQAVQFTISGKQNKGFNVPFNEELGIQVRDRTPSRALTN
ncbi:MAG: hypothetical protein JWM82_2480 [Myxococcales bacterium]|nr:hypothetical protein [Myxococcales bacterium]